MVTKMTRVLVENLPRDLVEGEMNDIFDKYGRVASFQLLFPSRSAAVAFIEYMNPQDAEAAYHGLHGSSFNGNKLHAELWHPSDSTQRMQDTTQHRIHLSGLPPSVTAKETRDLLVTTGSDVLGVEVDRRGNAWASFPTHYELKTAIRKLDDTDFRGERIRAVRAEPTGLTATPKSSKPYTASTSATTTSSSARAHSDLRSTRSRSRSRGRSPARGRSPRRYRARSPSRSPSRHRRSRSRSRSQSRSHR